MKGFAGIRMEPPKCISTQRRLETEQIAEVDGCRRAEIGKQKARQTRSTKQTRQVKQWRYRCRFEYHSASKNKERW
jgi:hypothetical protein